MRLDWENKDRTLLADGSIGYRWVNAPLPTETVEVFQQNGIRSSGHENSLIIGDLLDCTDWLETRYGKRSVSLIYIDPPFNTQKTFQSYSDRLSHDEWLSMFRDRLSASASLLKQDGSVRVHLDDSELHHARVVLDEIFGEEAFVGSIVWEKRTSRESRSALSSAHDTILIYSPSGLSLIHISEPTRPY